MATTLTQAEEAQLAQTIEMFGSLLKRSRTTINQPRSSGKGLQQTGAREGCRRHVQTHRRSLRAGGSIFLRHPRIRNHSPASLDDPEVQAALRESKPRQPWRSQPATTDTAVFAVPRIAAPVHQRPGIRSSGSVDDGRKQMHKIFVDGKIIAAPDFDLCWPTPDLCHSDGCDRALHPGHCRQRDWWWRMRPQIVERPHAGRVSAAR